MTIMTTTAFWQMPGVWIATVGAAFMTLNTFRALANPVGFAVYMGLPLVAENDANWVRVYALRALFVAISLAGLLAIQDVKALTIIAFSAVVMAFGDAILTSKSGASRATVVRHAVIGSVLLAGGLLLLRG